MTFVDKRRARVVVALALVWTASARADDNHYQNFLVGERATGLGGAFVAISDDSSGAYYNPAGLAEASYSSLSLSSSVYGFASHSYEGASIDGSDNRDFVSYPTMAAWIQRVRAGGEDGSGRVQLALSVVNPQTDVARQRIGIPGSPQATSNPNWFSIANWFNVTNSEDDTLWFGLSAAWKILGRLSVGATIYGTMRSGMYQVHQHKQGVVVDQYGTKLGVRIDAARLDIGFTHYGLLGVVGVIFRATEHLRLGASFRSPQFEIHGAADFNFINTQLDSNTGKTTFVATDIEDLSFRDRQPFKAAVGAAYIVPHRWGVSLDFSIYGPVGEYAIFETDQDVTIGQDARMKKDLVWQINAGGEYYIAGAVPLRIGFFTNRSSLASFEVCESSGVCSEHSNLMTDPIDLYGFSGSVGWESKRVTLNLGFSYCLGSKTEKFWSQDLTTSRSFMFLAMGGSFRF